MKHFTILISALLIIQNSWAQIENVDPGFGNNGIASAEFNNSADEAFSSLVLPNGKILIAGRTNAQQDRPIILAMFLANGQPDNSFGTNGKKTIATNQNGIVSLRTPLLQADGKIIIPGNLNVNNITRRMVVRLLPNGDLDNTFGNNGFFVSNNQLGTTGEDLVECFILPDGKIWGVGMTSISLPPDGNLRYRFSSFRLTSEGIIDTSYTKTTTFRLHAGTTGLGNDIAYTACRTPENGILLVGISSTSAGHTLLKLTAEGKVDSTFGNNGFTRQNPIYSTIFPRRIVPAQGGGYILCANARLSGTGNPDNTAIYKFTAAGLYDSTFGTNGIALTPYTGVPPTNPWAVDAVQDVSGRIWVAHFGQFISGGPRVFSVSRFLPNGNIDNTYGSRGHVSTSLGGIPRQIYLGTDGLPLLTGNGIYSGLTTDQDLVAIKVNPNPVSINPKIEKHLSITPSVVEKGQNFSVILPSDEPVQLMLISADGRQLPIAYQPTGNQIHCDTDQLSVGLYQVQIMQNQQVFQGRVLVR